MIVPIQEYGQHKGQLYIVMEYMPNGSLADRLARGPTSIGMAGKIVERMSTALDYAHSRGVIHRDLKPSNILFDENDNAVLADFGIALQAASAGANSDVISGTPAYMSPEQAGKVNEIDGRSDLYALGINIYQMLTGSLPFDGDTPVSILLKQMNEPPPTPLSLNPTLPPDLESFLATLLAKDPDERYQSGAEIVVAFYAAVNVDRAGGQPSAAETIFVSGKHEQPETIPAISSIPDTLESIPQLPLSSVQEDVTDTVGEKEPLLEAVIRVWTDRPMVALAVASILGIICAVVIVTGIRGPAIFAALRASTISGSTPAPAASQNQPKNDPDPIIFPTSEVGAAGARENANTMLVYTDAAMTVINISDDDLSLVDVTFKRVPVRNASEATFSASIWNQTTSQTVENLLAGDCYQLLRPDETSSDTQPNAIFLPMCDSFRGVLVARDEEWTIWMPDGDSTEFLVLRGEQIIHTCRLSDGRCEFYLPQP
jgi:serine/threonine protein kinase